jgi:hypothetical protein
LRTRELLPDSAIAAGAKSFEDEMKEHDKRAWAWLGVVIVVVLAIFTTFLVLWSGSFTASIKELSDAIASIPADKQGSIATMYMTAYAIQKAAWLGFLFSILFMASRNYTAHLHNKIIAQHRVNALRTYRSIIHQSKDEDRQIILGKAADCIFGIHQTGLTKGDGNENGTSVTAIMGAMPKAGGGGGS